MSFPLTFLDALEEHRVSYIYWKSTYHLAEALDGETDLDLLVAQRDAQRFRRLALQHGFKSAVPPPQRQYPGVEEYLGFDPATGRLAHLHVHYRLVLGASYVKNHRLPLEEALLSSARRQEPEGTLVSKGVMVPAPEWELAVLVARVLLKTRDRDLLRAVLGRSPFPKSIRAELAHLTSRVDQGELANVLGTVGSVIPRELVLDFMAAWQGTGLKPWRLLSLRRRMRRALAPYQRSPRWRATVLYLACVVRNRWPWGNQPHRRPATGGLTIGFVGADGAGKSTVVADTCHWLGWKLGVRTLYMGSKQPSWIPRSVEIPFRVARRLHRVCEARLGERNALTRLAAAVRYPLESIHAVALGIDRYRRCRLGFRAAGQGAVVLFDRFPLPEVYDVMDGPRVDPAWGGVCGPLARIERRLYQAIARPDHVVIMHVSPEVALARKPSQEPEAVIAKTAALRRFQGRNDGPAFREQAPRGPQSAGVFPSDGPAFRSDPHVTHVDAGVPLEQVVLRVRRIVWGLL